MFIDDDEQTKNWSESTENHTIFSLFVAILKCGWQQNERKGRNVHRTKMYCRVLNKRQTAETYTVRCVRDQATDKVNVKVAIKQIALKRVLTMSKGSRALQSNLERSMCVWRKFLL